MAVSATISRFSMDCGSIARPSSRPFFAGGGVQQCCAVTAVKMVSGNSKDWGKAKLRVESAKVQKSRTFAAMKAGVAVDVNGPPSVLVDTLLALVEDTDRGTQIGEPEKLAIEEIVGKLESLCIPEPLSSPLLFGDWDVAYSSNPTAPGGYYRSMLGRALLKTREMVQGVYAPDVITNKVAFAALGFLDGQVTLQGKLTALDQKWVEVVFESPQVELGPLKMQYGGNSNVKLATIYLDEVVRIGRGSRGSLFIFRRRT